MRADGPHGKGLQSRGVVPGPANALSRVVGVGCLVLDAAGLELVDLGVEVGDQGGNRRVFIHGANLPGGYWQPRVRTMAK